LRVPGPFGCLFGVLIDLGEEREDFFWGQGVEVSFAKLSGQFGKDRLVGFESVFLNEACDTPANNGYLERLSWCTSLDGFPSMLSFDYQIYN